MNSPVKTQWVDIAPGCTGLLALPPAGHGPGPVLWQEIFGVNAHIWLAAATTDVDAAGAFCGGGIQARLDRAPAVRCPLQFHCAAHDDQIPLDAVQHVQAAMPQAEVHVYPDAMHGFNRWARAS